MLKTCCQVIISGLAFRVKAHNQIAQVSEQKGKPQHKKLIQDLSYSTSGGNKMLPSVLNYRSCYHAVLATKLFGLSLTTHFLPSSKIKRAIPKPKGNNQCSNGTVDVVRTLWNLGIYKKNIAMRSEKRMAGNRYMLREARRNSCGCWRIERRRVRIAMRTNHCLEEFVS